MINQETAVGSQSMDFKKGKSSCKEDLKVF